MKIVNLKQRSPEWLAWRQNKVGGSDAPVIAGVSPYKTIRDLYYEKKGIELLEQDKGNEYIFNRGELLEDVARKDIFGLTGEIIKPVCGVGPGNERIIGSFDGFHEKVGPVEVKLVGDEVLKTAKNTGEIPRPHWIQIQHLLFVSDHDKAYWFGGNLKKECLIREIGRDQNFISDLVGLETAFLENLDAGIEPPVGPDDYFVPKDTMLLAKLAVARRAIKEYTELFERLKEEVINTYQHQKIAGPGIKIFRTERKGSVKYADIPEVKALKAEYLEGFRGKTTESWQVRLKGEK